VRAWSLLLGRTRSATDILPALSLVVVAIGATQPAAGGRGCAVLIIAPVHEGRRIAVLVSRVRGKDRDAALVVHPVVVGGDVIGRVPQLDLFEGEVFYKVLIMHNFFPGCHSCSPPVPHAA